MVNEKMSVPFWADDTLKDVIGFINEILVENPKMPLIEFAKHFDKELVDVYFKEYKAFVAKQFDKE